VIGVYAIVNTKTRMAYVGSSQNIKKRFVCHHSFLKKGKHHCAYLQKSSSKGNIASPETRLKQSLAKIGNRLRAKTVCTDTACFFDVNFAAKHYQVSTPTFRKMMQKNGWSFL